LVADEAPEASLWKLELSRAGESLTITPRDARRLDWRWFDKPSLLTWSDFASQQLMG
jgi:hypothetical protein